MDQAQEISVAILGLGRMGTAIARRLVEQGERVATWTRSGDSIEGAEAQTDPADAAAAARNLLVSLFDAPACAEVLNTALPGLSSNQTVLNMSTVSPSEAVELENMVRSTGAAYVHAPVLGSVGAASSGGLVILVGTSQEMDSRTEGLLSSLGHVVMVNDVSEAAAAKLLANGALASALHGIWESLGAADELGIDRQLALRILEHTIYGEFVSAKTSRLESARVSGAEFTVAALTKDVTLLHTAGTASGRIRSAWVSQVEQSGADGEDDIAAACRSHKTPDAVIDASSRLTVAPGLTVPPAVLVPLANYASGHATGDPNFFREAFLPSAHIEGYRDGQFVSWPLADYCALFTGSPAPDEGDRSRHIDSVEVSETVATARMTLHHGPDTFTDIFLLVSQGSAWHVANKAYYHRRV